MPGADLLGPPSDGATEPPYLEGHLGIGEVTADLRDPLDGEVDVGERLVELLVGDLRRAVEDVRSRPASLEGEWQQLLVELADNLERHVDAL
jgi:hypothetical protein